MQAYARIWSETLFLPLVVLTLAALARHLATHRSDPLILAAALSGAAMLTRYAGLALFVTACPPGRMAGAAGARTRRRRRRLRHDRRVAQRALAAPELARLGTLTGDNQLVHELRAVDIANGLRGSRAGWYRTRRRVRSAPSWSSSRSWHRWRSWPR